MEEKIISYELYGGTSIFSSQKAPYELRKIYCSNCDKCPLCKDRKECLYASKLTTGKCPYGRVESQRGKSSRSKSYYDLKYEYDNVPQELKAVLKGCSAMFGEIGDYYFLNPVYVNIQFDNERNKLIVSDGYISFYHNISIYKKELFTKEFWKELFNFKPKNLFGSTISEYYREIIPAIKNDILSTAPELAKELEIEPISHVGMLAKLKSLKPNIEVKLEGLGTYDIIKGLFDGECITVKAENVVDSAYGKSGCSCFIGKPVGDVKFLVDDTVYVKVLDEAWTTPNTIYKREI